MSPVTRRELLKSAGLSLVLAGMPHKRLLAQAPGPVMQALSAYMADAATRALPSDVVEHTKHHILDTFAAMISGSELPPGQAALRFARAQGGAQTATVV